MNNITKKQHYVWRYYLAPWTNDNSSTGRIYCARNGYIFQSKLMNVAHENYFYTIKELSQQEKDLIYLMAIRNTNKTLQQINETWLELYCAPYTIRDTITPVREKTSDIHDDNYVHDAIKQFCERMSKDYVETIHCKIESEAIKYIEMIRNHSLDFWKDAEARDIFSFYISNQYFRTKKTRECIIKAFEENLNRMPEFSGINPRNMWIPLSLIFASNVGMHISNQYKPVLLQSTDNDFIVGDQPIINTYATDNNTAQKDMELFYPITPSKALLLTKNPTYHIADCINIDSNQVEKFNILERNSSFEMLFAKDSSHLRMVLSK